MKPAARVICAGYESALGTRFRCLTSTVIREGERGGELVLGTGRGARASVLYYLRECKRRGVDPMELLGATWADPAFLAECVADCA